MSKDEYDLIPEPIRREIDDHVKNGGYTGTFVTSVLSNDLQRTIGYADENSMKAMKQIVKYCVNNIPFKCWGSFDKVTEWKDLKRKKE